MRHTTLRPPMMDTFGRIVGDLRISLTDRCSLRCSYCMPAQGLPWLARDQLLTVAEIERLGLLFVRLGVGEIKLTGGEPTARSELVDVVRALRAIDDRIDLSITSNGLLLDRLAEPLRAAGLDRVTVSCDSLQRHRFAEMTRRDALDRVLAGLRAAEAAGFAPIKLNCVVIRGTNDDEVRDFARLARRTGYDVRFIEYMPLDAEERWDVRCVVASEEIRGAIEERFPLVPDDTDGPARRYRFADGAPGSIGFISSVTEPFCASCNRVRITADGHLRACLFALEETDLRTPMRCGATDSELEALIRATVRAKWAGHRIGHASFARPARSMSQIGG